MDTDIYMLKSDLDTSTCDSSPPSDTFPVMPTANPPVGTCLMSGTQQLLLTAP